MAIRLRQRGITRVRPLAGGFHGWRDLSSRDGEHRKIRKQTWLTCSHLNLLVSDIVFANAGIAKYALFGGITEELCDSIFNINVKGLFFTVQEALPLLTDGVIFATLINTDSFL